MLQFVVGTPYVAVPAAPQQVVTPAQLAAAHAAAAAAAAAAVYAYHPAQQQPAGLHHGGGNPTQAVLGPMMPVAYHAQPFVILPQPQPQPLLAALDEPTTPATPAASSAGTLTPSQQPRLKRHNPYGAAVVAAASPTATDEASTPLGASGAVAAVASPSFDSPLAGSDFGGFVPTAARFAGHHPHHHHHAQQQQHHHHPQPQVAAGVQAAHMSQPVTTEELRGHVGALAELARTAPGSSFIQAALRDGAPHTAANVALIAAELLPAAGTLLLDAHGCYVVKTLMERLAPAALQVFVRDAIASDAQLVFSMCTHSLHTRRVVQYLMDAVDPGIVAGVLTARCAEVSTTQQGCIVMQRAMDVTPEPARATLFETIYQHVLPFASDPFANYVVQHLLEVGDRARAAGAIIAAFRGHVVRLSCNKYASNVVEKCLFHLDAEAQHALLAEMYGGDEASLLAMLQDSFGNYLIQSSIALAPFRDVLFISERLRDVLPRTPYGHKIEQRLERRLKGRPVGTRSPAIGANSKSSRRGGATGNLRSGSFAGGVGPAAGQAASDSMEDPW